MMRNFRSDSTVAIMGRMGRRRSSAGSAGMVSGEEELQLLQKKLAASEERLVSAEAVLHQMQGILDTVGTSMRNGQEQEKKLREMGCGSAWSVPDLGRTLSFVMEKGRRMAFESHFEQLQGCIGE
uniref:Uncharacterized protein n=1 Tax=Chromera velia CCMP2878 TaxID=1169474 RepID=A0A0G4GDQ6_9ALVE|eukprot:Cvel_21434.t1-p1 / transcript=Cvel_21434.t1 / gene=Cvel_21434 / organism=Chromera_velia_CCMP2878 / gene_product=hypothetical protein / transcript_product=hypothetical protein / location=Cvel_scaffold2009:30105-30817(-) / protein_length=124 / sequence_SO=supercontig / SO=protein_coding / is_pseudo=false